MAKKRDEPREIPIKFADNGKGAGDIEAVDPRDEPESDEQADAMEVQSDSAAEPVIEKEPHITAVTNEVGSDISDLQVQIDTLTAEKSALYDQLLRRQAEFENYRRRIERERTDVFQRARADVLVEMIPILDNLERALMSLEQSEGDAEALRHGVELIHKQFKDALAKFGLQPVESVGCTFDPHIHEAVTVEPTDEHQENTIIEEFQRGYKLGDRLLRPAKVKVASSPER